MTRAGVFPETILFSHSGHDERLTIFPLQEDIGFGIVEEFLAITIETEVAAESHGSLLQIDAGLGEIRAGGLGSLTWWCDTRHVSHILPQTHLPHQRGLVREMCVEF